MRFRYSALLLLLAAGVSEAANPEKVSNDPPKPDVKSNAVEARFADGSTVKMTLLQDHVEVMTRYGKLSIPTSEIRRIEFGLRLPETTARRIDEAVIKLGSADFKERSAASVELLSLRELAFPAVQRAAASSDLEVAQRAQEVLKGLREKVSADKLQLKAHDVIRTTEFPIFGRIESGTLKARTAYFGDVNLRLDEMRSLRWLAPSGESEVSVDAARYGLVKEEWFDSGIELGADVDLEINATGTIDLYPIGGEMGMYLTSPAGSMQWSRGGPYPNGALLGRIGDTGKVFVVGQKFEGTTTGEGKLYFRIVASPWQNVPSGSYTVRVVAAGGKR